MSNPFMAGGNRPPAGYLTNPNQFKVSEQRNGPFPWSVSRTYEMKTAYDLERERIDQYRRQQEEAAATIRRADAERAKEAEIAKIQLDMDKKLKNAEKAVKEGEVRRLLEERDRKEYGANSREEFDKRWKAREAERIAKLKGKQEKPAPAPAPAAKKEEKLAIARPIRKKSGYEGVVPAASRKALNRLPTVEVATRAASRKSSLSGSSRYTAASQAGAAALSQWAANRVERAMPETSVRIKRRR